MADVASSRQDMRASPCHTHAANKAAFGQHASLRAARIDCHIDRAGAALGHLRTLEAADVDIKPPAGGSIVAGYRLPFRWHLIGRGTILVSTPNAVTS